MKRLLLLLVSAFALPSVGAAAQAQAPKPLFAASDPIHIVVQGPLSTLDRNRANAEGVAGTVTDPSGQALPVRLTLRGITRRASDTCDFPPLRVEFANPPPASSIFAGERKLKLVTHCRNSASFQQYVLLEYAAYRMYNLLTPRSFRVRLANVDYVDPNGHPIISRAGFFLEELKDVAHRNGLKVEHAPAVIPVADLSPVDAARYAMFQHLIANHDWSMHAGPAGKDCCHNAELIGVAAPAMSVPIPYDFDFSGLVDAPYATPPDVLRISSVTQRVYRGYCIHNPQELEVARQMREARPDLIAAITSTPGLDPHTAQRAISFLDRFFEDIASDDSVQSKVLVHCLS